MPISQDQLITREGVLRYPDAAAAYLAANPPGSTNPLLTNAVMATRAGVLRFPNEAASFIDNDIIELTEAEWEALTEYDLTQEYSVEGVGSYLGATLVTPAAFTYNDGVDLFVSKTGSSDANPGTDPLLPKLTIASAFNAISVSNTEPITIWVDAGTYAENVSGGYFLFTKAFAFMVTIRGMPGTLPILTAASGSYVIRPNNTCANVRFRNLEIQSIAASTNIVYYNGTNLTNFELIECHFNDANSKATGINFDGASGQSNIAVKRCTFTSASTLNTIMNRVTNGKFIGNDTTDTLLGGVTCTAGTFSINSNIVEAHITTAGHATNPTEIEILGNTCRNIVYTGGATGNKSLLNIDRNTVTAGADIVGISILGYTEDGTCNYNTVTSLGTVGIGWPIDGGTSECIGQTISYNNVTNNHASGHGILVSIGGTDATVTYNTSDQSGGGAYGMVIKGTNNTVSYNTITGGSLTGILLKDCTGPVFTHNVVYSDGASAVALRFDEVNTATVTNNTFYVTGGTLYTLTLANDGVTGNNFVDVNNYSISDTGAWGTMFGNTVSDLDDVKAQWFAGYAASPFNDQNSAVVLYEAP